MKRFTATEKWQKPWFRKLPPRVKCLFQFLCDNCDHAGVIDPDWDLMTFMIGEKVGIEDISGLNENVIVRDGKLFIPDYIRFQYGKLNPQCKPHIPVLEALKKHGIGLSEVNQMAFDGLLDGIERPQEKEKEKEEERDRGSLRGIQAEIETIYDHYPRKVGRPRALQSIARAISRGCASSRLLEKTKAYAAAVVGMDPDFIPHPSTWFNQERFNDDPSTWSRKNSGGGAPKPTDRNFGIAPDPGRSARIKAAVDAMQ